MLDVELPAADLLQVLEHPSVGIVVDAVEKVTHQVGGAACVAGLTHTRLTLSKFAFESDGELDRVGTRREFVGKCLSVLAAVEFAQCFEFKVCDVHGSLLTLLV